MISGSIILIDDHIEDKLDGLEWNRKDGHFKLKSLIQYNQNNLSVGGKRIKTTLKSENPELYRRLSRIHMESVSIRK
jgi:hypothetical protein